MLLGLTRISVLPMAWLQQGWCFNLNLNPVNCFILNYWIFTTEQLVLRLPLSCWFQNSFFFQDWIYFSGRCKLFTTHNHKCHLYHTSMLFVALLQWHQPGRMQPCPSLYCGQVGGQLDCNICFTYQVVHSLYLSALNCGHSSYCNLFIYQAREFSLVPEGFLTAQFLQEM